MKHIFTHFKVAPSFIFFFCFLFFCQQKEAIAQDFYYPSSGSPGSILRADDLKTQGSFPMSCVTSVSVLNEISLNPSTWRTKFKLKSNNYYVKFFIEDVFNKDATSNYTYKATYELRLYKTYYTTAGTYDQFYDTLTISYSRDSLSAYQDQQVKRYTGKYTNGEYLMGELIITGIYDVTANPNATTLPSPINLSSLTNLNFAFEVQNICHPYYLSNYGSNGSLYMGYSSPVENDYLKVNWATSDGKKNTPCRYELEWTYVDNYDVDIATDTTQEAPASSLKFDFKHNSTRVWTDSTQYKIPLIYQRGYLIYRVRMVRPDSTNFETPIYSNWSLPSNQGSVAALSATTNYYKIDTAHINDSLNWQYTISFAEQGKSKQVLSYYDGLLKNRQTITRFNSQPDKLIVTENVFDHEGNTAIKILPTPVNSERFTYQDSVSLNSLTGLPYMAQDFDTLRTSLCPGEIPPAPLDSFALASIYYSPKNPDKSKFQKFVPDAEGYPFVQTIYVPGYSDRVEKQGGASASLQIGNGHNTIYNYVDADQMDLNRYFGTDIGWAGFYRKTVTEDPNGQLALNITDYKGRQVMSSIIGGGPDSVYHAIVPNPNVPDTTYWENDVLLGTPQQIINNTRIAHKSFFMDVTANSFVEYEYKFTPFATGCPDKYLSVSASYDYTIIDQCGNVDTSDAGILGYTGVVSADTGVPYPTGRVPVFLEKGKHTLDKTLTVNFDDVYAAVDSFLIDPNNCLKTEPEFIKEEVLERTFPCPFDTLDGPCGQKKRQMMAELYPGAKYGKYKIVGGQITPPDTAGYSIFDKVDATTWRYQDTCMDTIHAYVEYFGQTYDARTVTPDVLVKVFNDDVAEALLPLHPEYCKLLQCFNDTFKKKLEAIPNAKIAEKLGLLYLDDIIAADPIKPKLLYAPFSFVSPADSLASFKGGMRYDTLMTLYAYCGCTDTVMFKECVNDIFKTEINSLALINDQVKESYFQSILKIYISKREEYKRQMREFESDTCTPCKQVPSQRMSLIPDPVFPKVLSTSGNGPDSSAGSINYWNQFANANDPVLDSLIKTIKDLMSSQPDSMYKYQDSSIKHYNANNNLLCTGQIDSIVFRLFNCFEGDTNLINSVKGDLLDLCANGEVQFGDYSPEQIRTVLVNNGISLGDLCNPYLVNYDKFPIGDESTKGNVSCRNANYYSTQLQFFNRQDVLDAYKNLQTVYTFSLTTSNNNFEEDLSDSLNGATSVAVIAEYKASDSLYILRVYDAVTASDTIKIYLRGSGGSVCSHFFNNAGTDVISFIDVKCIKSSSALIGPGYIGNYAFTAYVNRVGSSQSNTCSLLGWSNKAEAANYNGSKIADCIPCTEMRTLYQEFMDTLGVYDVKGVDHPYYKQMLRSFITYKTGRTFSIDQYLRFIQSCALADSMFIKNYVGYANLTFSSPGAANTFLSNIENLDSSSSFSFPYIEDSTFVVLDFRQLPNFKLWEYRSFIDNYVNGVVSKNVNSLLQDGQSSNTVGFFYTPASYSFTPSLSTILGAISSDFTISSAATKDVNIGGVDVPCNIYYVYKSGSTTPSKVSEAVEKIEKYFYLNGLPTVFLSNYHHTVDDDYYSTDKKTFLNYVYSMQGLSVSEVLDTLREYYLNQLSGYQNSSVTYTIPSDPSNTTNLYVTDPNGNTNNLYNKLTYIMNTVRNFNSNKIFFANNKTAILGAEILNAYRCEDGSYWYRYFGTGDTMYNVYVKMPDYLSIYEQQQYELSSTNNIIPAPGDSTTRFFYMTLVRPGSPSDTLTISGMTDFVIASNNTLENVLLGNPVNAKYPAPDTFENCERQRLRSGIIEGKFRYAFYIDSVRDALRAQFKAHVMNNIYEKLLVGYVDQRFQTTLYYYDRAGNLMRTVPPEGIRPIGQILFGGYSQAQVVSQIDTFRQRDTINVPNHAMVSYYNYNTLNQLTEQKTPDGGRTKFYYDAAGRLIYSQNAKQFVNGYFTYSLYDKQSRIIETGEARLGCPGFDEELQLVYDSLGNVIGENSPPGSCFHINNTIEKPVYTPTPPQVFNLQSYTHDAIKQYIRSMNRRDVVLTIYDTMTKDLGTLNGLSTQENLRKRVAAVKYFVRLISLDTFFKNYDHASYYSYDPMGNVQTLTHEFPILQSIKQQYKRIDYDYDLISGKVNLLSYNRSFADQYYQRYTYDQDNRIKKVETSADGYIWTRDAEYDYYQHGPLATMSLGDYRVQGVDYAYTVQGWLKAINGDILDPDKDMGQHMPDSAIKSKDVFAMTLEYFPNDYKPIDLANEQVQYLPQNLKGLYNGNIAGKKTAIAPFPSLSTKYTYDQLNRIHITNYESVDAVNQTLTSISDYRSQHWYDQNGNIKKLTRRGNSAGNTIGGTTQLMDSLEYQYNNILWSGLPNNRLEDVAEYATHTYTGTNDIQPYSTTLSTRYLYDEIGNTTKDLVSGQDSILWNLFNKVTKTWDKTDTTEMVFRYDAMGNRVAKEHTRQTDTNYIGNNEYYIRDAQGNILAIYRRESSWKWTKGLRYYTALNDISGSTSQTDLADYVGPLYSIDPNFTNQYTDYVANIGNGWMETNINNTSVSAFLPYNGLKDRMLQGGQEYVGPLYTYTQSNSVNIIGDAWKGMFANNDPGDIDGWTMALFNNPDATAVQTICEILCNADNSGNIMADIASWYSLDNLGTCTDKAEDLEAALKMSGDYAQFASYMSALYGNYPTDFDGFLDALAADNTTMTNPYYMGMGGVLAPALQQELVSFGNETDLYDFFDNWGDGMNQLQTVADMSELNEVLYNMDPTDYIAAYTVDENDINPMANGLAAIASLNFNSFIYAAAIQFPAYDPNTTEVALDQVKVMEADRYYLAEHHLYGSSRLGIKNYWKDHIYMNWDYNTAQLTPFLDSTRMGARQPWYSMQHQDLIKSSKTTPYSNAQTSLTTMQHMIGTKQYELTNHLGNVQATVSDHRRGLDTNSDYNKDIFLADIKSAYDYYPFGSLMPGRYVQDTTQNCAWVTQTVLVPGLETISLGDPAVYASPGAMGWGQLGTATLRIVNSTDTTLVVSTSQAQGGMVNTSYTASLGYVNQLTIDVASVTGDWLAVVEEQVNGQWVQIANKSITTPEPVSLTYTPTASALRLSIFDNGLGGVIHSMGIYGYSFQRYVYTPTNMLVQVCDEVDDKYRFGFNGKEKDNEWAGLGNHQDYGFRLYDTRIGRFKGVDPLTSKFPMLTPYQFSSNNPIWFIDIDGAEGEVHNILLWKNSNGETQVSGTTKYNVGGREDGILYNIHVENGVSYSVFVRDVVITGKRPGKDLPIDVQLGEWLGNAIGNSAVGTAYQKFDEGMRTADEVGIKLKASASGFGQSLDANIGLRSSTENNVGFTYYVGGTTTGGVNASSEKVSTSFSKKPSFSIYLSAYWKHKKSNNGSTQYGLYNLKTVNYKKLNFGPISIQSTSDGTDEINFGLDPKSRRSTNISIEKGVKSSIGISYESDYINLGH